MPHSYTKIWIHAIWTTKGRTELIDYSFEKQVYDLIFDELKELNCPTRIINGMPDHVHTLFLLNPQKSLADVLKQVKGSVSHALNGSELLPGKFAWQTGYAAFSVSESQLQKVHDYIKNQKNHHRKMNFDEEQRVLLKLHDVNE